MPELKDSLGFAAHYINPHTGRQHAALIIKVRSDETVNLVHFDPESGLQQMRLAVAYSLPLIANTFHWIDDQNEPQTKEEKAAAALSTVTSVQTVTGPPPSASVATQSVPSPQQSQSDAPILPKGSFELQQSDAPSVAPSAGTIPPESPEAALVTPQGANPEGEPLEAPKPALPPEPQPHPEEIADTPQAPAEQPQEGALPEGAEGEAEAWEQDPEVTEQDPFAHERRERRGENE
jgi:hypothetical protein